MFPRSGNCTQDNPVRSSPWRRRFTQILIRKNEALEMAHMAKEIPALNGLEWAKISDLGVDVQI